MVNASAPDSPRVRQHLRASFPNLETLPTKPNPQVSLRDQFGLSYYLQRCERMEGPICRSRFLNLTASGRAFRCGSAPTVISSSPCKTTGGKSEMTFVPVSKSGSSKVGAIPACRRWLRERSELTGRAVVLL